MTRLTHNSDLSHSCSRLHRLFYCLSDRLLVLSSLSIAAYFTHARAHTNKVRVKYALNEDRPAIQTLIMTSSINFNDSTMTYGNGSSTPASMHPPTLDDLCKNLHVSPLLTTIASRFERCFCLISCLAHCISLRHIDFDCSGEYFRYSSIKLLEKTS